MTQLMMSFKGYTVPTEILDLVQRGEVVAFCLFNQNVESLAQLQRLCFSIHAAAQAGGHPTPIIGIDQEGGQLIAIANGATELPGNMALGATGSPELAEKAGRVLARELRALGINMNFAPILDVNVNPHNAVIGIRSFGDTPALVAEMASAQIRGMQAEGIIATAKHFPGHGDTEVDSHIGLPIVPHDRQRLDAIEIAPFVSAIAENVGAVMSSHILYPALDADKVATMSTPILTGLLRESLGYQGLIVTDAMDMHAVSSQGVETSIIGALNAGADLIMLGHLPQQTTIYGMMKPRFNAASMERIREAQTALSTVDTHDAADLSVIGCAAHLEIAQEIADRSITLVRDQAGRLPLAAGSLAVVTVEPRNLTPADTSASATIRLGEAIQKRRPDAQALTLPYGADEAALQKALAAVEGIKTVIVGTLAADKDASQAAFIDALTERGQMPVVVALRTPYDITAFPQIDTYLCAYGLRDVTTEAVARVLFGEIPATGVLPCAIPGISEPI